MRTRRSVFFFQAEDGIRDGHVTGVQTCALPICLPNCSLSCGSGTPPRSAPSGCASRSEERRVGKECRSRWPRGDEKKREQDTGEREECAGDENPKTSVEYVHH